jgi:hypothetical protein
MSSPTLSTILLALVAVSATACGAAPVESTEPNVASSEQQALVRNACSPYDSFTGALGAATIDCLGRVGTFDYALIPSAVGGVPPTLVRRFEACPNIPSKDDEAAKLLQIDELLSIQLPERQNADQRKQFPDQLRGFPTAGICVAQAFQTAQQRLVEQHITTCPTFKQAFSIGSPTEANIKRIVSLLPQPKLVGNPPKLGFPPGSFGPKFRSPKEYPLYTVNFEQPPPTDQPCQRAETCVKACASVFQGFMVARFGHLIVGDPDAWQDPLSRGFGPSSPYWQLSGYFHPMAESGGPPGVLYGNIARALLTASMAPNPVPETCTYWTPDSDYGEVFGTLVPDMAGTRNALSRCQP